MRHIKDVYRMHQKELDAITDDTERGRRLVELNVKEQVYDLAKTSIVQNAWAKGQQLFLHGIVYDLYNGLLVDLDVNVSDNSQLPDVYVFDSGIVA